MTNPQSNLPSLSQPLPQGLAKAMSSLSPEEKKEANEYLHAKRVAISSKTISASRIHYEGPLPPPEMLQAYELITPGFATRILSMAESQSAHRIEIEKHVIPSREKFAGRGQIFAFVLGIFGISCGTYCAINGQPTAGSIIGGGTVVSLASVFLVGRSKQQPNLDQKRPEVPPRRNP